MQFSFTSAGRIVFGPGTVHTVADTVQGPVLLVCGSDPARCAPLTEDLNRKNIAWEYFSISGEPSTRDITEGAALARTMAARTVIGMGGGSVLDTAKAVSALLTNEGDLLDYLEVIGAGRPLAHPAAPCIAIPTTAGTGAEVTKNAVITSPEHRVKVSMRSDFMLPRMAVVDPTLTYSLPARLTATTGLDALTQLLEAYVSRKANPMTDGFCREGLSRARHLENACQGDSAAREDLSLSALLSGLALANAGLGAVHGFAAPLGGFLNAPHGAICARLLPLVMETNIAVLEALSTEHPSLARYDEAARILCDDPDARAQDGVIWVQGLVDRLEIRSLSCCGLREQDIPELVYRAAGASSMKGNPADLSTTQLEDILRQAL